MTTKTKNAMASGPGQLTSMKTLTLTEALETLAGRGVETLYSDLDLHYRTYETYSLKTLLDEQTTDRFARAFADDRVWQLDDQGIWLLDNDGLRTGGAYLVKKPI
ncbi:MAG: hypothetical protein KA118_18260 [Verrucomicrobia bacterium]|nr:hypothetical protein [Verrucomicrobiota bacterium]